MPIKPLAIGVKRFCEEANIGKTNAYELINSGAVKSVLIGRRRLIIYDSLERLLGTLQDEEA